MTASASHDSSDSPVSHEDARALLQRGPILLYDGSCGVCNRSIQWILAHEKQQGLRFSALESPVGTRLRTLAGIDPSVDSLLWVEEGENGRVTAAIRSTAILRVLDYVGGLYRLLLVFWIVPRFLRDAGYAAFARVRHRVAPSMCLLPTPEQRRRFVESAS